MAVLCLLSPRTIGAALGEFPEANLEITGEVALPPELSSLLESQPVISVRVPDNGWVVINPYGLEVARDGLTSTEPVVSPVMVMENESAVPVRVDARAIGTVPEGSEAVFVSAPPSPGAWQKEVFLYAEFQNGVYPSWSGAYTGMPNQLAVSSGESPEAWVMTLGAGGEASTFGSFRMFGSVAESPEEAWSGIDAIHVTLSFTFRPLSGNTESP